MRKGKNLIFHILSKFCFSVKKSCWTYTFFECIEALLKTGPDISLKFLPYNATEKMYRKKNCHTPTFTGLIFDHDHRNGPGDHAHGCNSNFVI